MLRNRQLLRQLSVIRYLRLNQRLYSTSEVISVREKLFKLKETKNISPSIYSELLKHNDIVTGREVEIVDEIIELARSDSNVTDEHRVQLHNFVLKNLVKYDYSLSTVHQRELSDLKGQVDLDSMVEIIKYNPGRVKSSWELFETAMDTHQRDPEEYQELLETVLAKLVHGDASEIEDGYIMNEKAVLRSVFLLKSLKNPPQDLSQYVLVKALEFGNYGLIDLIGLNSLEQIKSLEPNTEQFVKLWLIWNPDSLSNEDIRNNIELLNKLLLGASQNEQVTSSTSTTEDSLKDLENLKKKFPTLQTDLSTKSKPVESTAFHQLVRILEDSGVLKNPETKYTSLRITLLKSYGINKGDYNHALYLYHEFIALDKHNVDAYMTTMVNVSAYLSVKNNNQQQLQIAEALIPQPVPVKSLQAQILGFSAFDIEKSLEIFNSNIQQVSKENNEQGISIAGLLTESLLIAYLSKKDREFAYLIHDGAIMNNIVTSETGKKRMKAIFKRYGEIVGEDNDTKIDGLLKEEVLKAIREL